MAGDPSVSDAVALCRDAVARAAARAIEVVIIDTAGRLHIDEVLMAELGAIGCGQRLVAGEDDPPMFRVRCP